jgi:DNA modification methylase
MMTFAPDYPRNDVGWILFPEGRKEQQYRKTLFPSGVMKHPAKANLFMMWELIEYLTEPNDLILDPMAGTGTVMIAAVMEQPRRVIAIDIEKPYHDIMLECKESFRRIQPDIDSLATVLHGNCKQFLPIPAQAIIFSPPYTQVLDRGKPTPGDIRGDMFKQTDEELQAYYATRGNVGKLPKFFYEQEMEKIYRLCYQSLPSGGTMTIIIKDYIEKDKRIYLSGQLIKMCAGIGFLIKNWFKRDASGSPFTRIRRSRGEPTVDDEDIIIFERS